MVRSSPRHLPTEGSAVSADERRADSDDERQIKSLASDSVVTGGLTLVGIALSLTAVLLWTHALPPEAYAALGTFLLVGQVGRSLLASYSQTALLHFGRLEVRDRGEAGRSFWSAISLAAPTLLVGAAAGFFFAGSLSSYLGGGWTTVLLVEAYVVVLAVMGLHTHRLQAERRFGLATGLGILDRGFVVIAATALVFSATMTASQARLIVLAAAASSLMIGLLIRPPGLPRVADVTQLGPMARFSGSIVIGVWAGTLFAWGDFALATHWLSAAELGCYYLAVQGLSVLLQLSQVVGVVSGPLAISLVASDQMERARQLFGRGSAQLGLFASTLLAVLIACTTFLFPFAVPDAYAATLEPLVVLIAASATAPLYFLSLSVFNAYRRPDLITAATVVLGGGNLVLSLLLVPWFGAIGAALAKGLSLVIGSIYACRRSFQLLEVAWPSGLLLALAPAFVAAVLALLYPGHYGGLAAATFSCLAAAAALRYGNLLEPDDVVRLQTVGFPTWTRSMLQAALRFAS